MITNYSIIPHPCLTNFITRYTLCKSENDNISMTFPMYANHECCLYFSLGNLPKQEDLLSAENASTSINKVSLFGLLTRFKGNIQIEGKSIGFIIEFKPNGFNRLFGIAANEICNNNFPANEVLGRGVEDLYEQLLY